MKLLNALAGFVLSVAVGSAYAQYPDRPVKVINPFSVGGSGDIVQRIFAQKISQVSGKTFIVENKPGASGIIGYGFVAQQRPDGYTLVAADATYTILPALYKTLPWNTASDLVPITIYAKTPFVLVVSPKSRFKTLKELIDFAKANPGKLSFGSAGIGSINQLVMEVFDRKAGIEMKHVPYKGMGDALNGVMTNSIDVIATGAPTVMGQIRGGQVRALGVSADHRWPGLTDVPTFAEAGVPVMTYSWMGIMGPKGLPPSIVDYLRDQVTKVVNDPATKTVLAQQGLEPSGMSAADFQKLLTDDTKYWGATVRAANITAR